MKIEGRHFQTGQHIVLHFEDGFISEIVVESDKQDATLPIIAPGLVDLRIVVNRIVLLPSAFQVSI